MSALGQQKDEEARTSSITGVSVSKRRVLSAPFAAGKVIMQGVRECGLRWNTLSIEEHWKDGSLFNVVVNALVMWSLIAAVSLFEWMRQKL